jgi:hypothetical protein
MSEHASDTTTAASSCTEFSTWEAVAATPASDRASESGASGSAPARACGAIPRSQPGLFAVPKLHVNLDLAVDLHDDATEVHCVELTHLLAEGRTDPEQDVLVIVQVHDDVQVHLQYGICTWTWT